MSRLCFLRGLLVYVALALACLAIWAAIGMSIASVASASHDGQVLTNREARGVAGRFMRREYRVESVGASCGIRLAPNIRRCAISAYKIDNGAEVCAWVRVRETADHYWVRGPRWISCEV